jgi:PAS domain S-box-containing protein
VERTAAAKNIDFSVFEAMPVNSILVGIDGPRFSIIALTDQYLKIFGITRDRLVGQEISHAIANGSDDMNSAVAVLRDSFEEVIRTKNSHNIRSLGYDFVGSSRQTTSRLYDVSNKPVFNSSGELSYIIHTLIDVTVEDRPAQSKVQLLQVDKTLQLFMQAPVAVCIVKGPDYIVELANEAMLQFLGRESSMMGRPIIESLPEAKLQGLIDILQHVRNTGQTYQISSFPAELMINEIREVRFFDLVFKPYQQNASDAETSIFCLANNVTEQVRSRQQVSEMTATLNFRNAIFEAQNQSSSDGVLIVDSNGEMILYNRRFAEIWRIPEEVLSSRSDADALKQAANQLVEPALFLEKVTEIYHSLNVAMKDEVYFKDGRVIERTGTPVIGVDGANYGWAWNFRDITARIQQEQKFRNVLEQAPTPIFILKGPALILEVANKPLLNLWNTDEQAVGKPLLEILPEMKDQHFYELLQKVYREHTPYYGHEEASYFLRPDGNKELHYFNYTYQPYQENDGSVTGVLVMSTDVTEQVIATQKIRETEANFRTLLMQAPVGICLLRGDDFEVELANDSCLEIIRRSREDVVGKSIFVTMPELKGQGFSQILQEVLSSGNAFAAYEYETHINHDEYSEQLFLDFVYQPLRETDGRNDRIMVVVTDITTTVLARKKIEEAEERARLAVESGELGTYEVNLRTNQIIPSARLGEIMGITLPADRNAFINAFVDEDKPVREAAHREALVTGKLQYSARIKKQDNSIHWIKAMGKIYFDEANTPMKLVGVVQDITEQKLFAEELSRLVHERTKELRAVNEELKRSNTELEQFAYISSHDLQEPLRKIKIFSTMIMEKDRQHLSEFSVNRFNKIVEAADRMMNSLRDLLEFASLSNRDRFEQVDLNWVIGNVRNDLELAIGQRNAHVEYENLPTLHAIPLQMHQLFYNLLNNALKFSKDGVDPVIRIQCRILAREEVKAVRAENVTGFYEISVIDNGIGFDEMYAEKIFTIFKRLHTRETYHGTGIGLSICRKVVHNHGGEIYARSGSGSGATFIIQLPFYNEGNA